MASELNPVKPQVLDGTLALANVLDQYQVNYAVIGGLAAGYRTHPRATRDIDILLQVPQLVLPKVLETLEQNGFEFDLLPTIRAWIDHHMVVLSYHGIRVDWLKAVIPAYAAVLERATDESWLGRRIRVASAEGLILMKLLAGRTQDWLDIENLVAAQRGQVDLAWLQTQWQTAADANDPRMARFLELVARVQEMKLES
jgi:hypothetical protein